MEKEVHKFKSEEIQSEEYGCCNNDCCEEEEVEENGELTEKGIKYTNKK